MKISHSSKKTAICKTCNTEKDLTLFVIDKRRPQGRGSKCYDWKKIFSTLYQLKNRKKATEQQKLWRSKNREKYNKTSREYKRYYNKEAGAIRLKLIRDLNLLLRSKSLSTGSRSANMLGYNKLELINHLNGNSKYTYEEYLEPKNKLSIDHIVPISKFTENAEINLEATIKKANKLSNLRIIKLLENQTKRNSLMDVK